MSFYGNITNVPTNTFTFDKYYPNKYEMMLAAADDNVFIGRYAAIEYEQHYNTETQKDKDGKEINQLKYYNKDKGIEIKIDESDNTKYTIIYYKGDEVISSQPIYVEYEADGTLKPYSNYKINSTIDDLKYGENNDSTGWVKEVNATTATYKKIADLNGVVPSFDIALEPPSELPKPMHFDEEINKVAYKLHQQPQWGFRVKEASDNKPSDVTASKILQYTYSDENEPYLQIKNDSGEFIDYSDTTKDYLQPSDIYFNLKGFEYDKETKADDTITDSITILPTGSSGLLYQTHTSEARDTEDYTEATANDIYELSIILPSLGNAVSKMWNIVYGEGDSSKGNARNTEIAWNNTDGIRNVDTLAGCINTIHDLMGQILVFKEKDENGNIQFRFPDGSIKTEFEVSTTSNFDIYSKYIYVFENGKHYKLCKTPNYSNTITKPTNSIDAFYLATFEEEAEYCVVEDTKNKFNKYSLWNTNNIYVPSSVTLAKVQYNSVYDFKEITNSFNSIYNLLLNTIDLLGNFNDNENRNKETVQGCINIINDIITRFDNLKPYNVLSTDEFGRVSSTEGIGDFQLINYNDRIESKGGSNEKVAVKRYVGYIKGTFNGEIKISNDVDSIGFEDENRSLCTKEELNDSMPQFSVVLHELNNYNNFRSGWGVYSGNNFILTSITNGELPASGSTYLVTRGDSQEPHAPQGYYYLYSPQKTQDADIDGKKDSLNVALRKLENKTNKAKNLLSNYWSTNQVIQPVSIEDSVKTNSKKVVTNLTVKDNKITSEKVEVKDLKINDNTTVQNLLDKTNNNTNAINNLKGNSTGSLGDLQNQINNIEKNIGTDKLKLVNYQKGTSEEEISNQDSVDSAFGKLQNQIGNLARMEVTLGGVGTNGVADKNAQIVKSIEFKNDDSSLYQNVGNAGDLELDGYKTAVRRGYIEFTAYIPHEDVLLDDSASLIINQDGYFYISNPSFEQDALYKLNEKETGEIKINVYYSCSEGEVTVREVETYGELIGNVFQIKDIEIENFYADVRFKITRLDADNKELIAPTGYDIAYVDEISTDKTKLQPTDTINEAFGKLQKQIDDKEFDTSSLIGQPGAAEGAEIFNNYEKNQAIGQYSHAQGLNTLAGAKAFTIVGIEINDDGVSGKYQLNRMVETDETIEFLKERIEKNSSEYHYSASIRFKYGENKTQSLSSGDKFGKITSIEIVEDKYLVSVDKIFTPDAESEALINKNQYKNWSFLSEIPDSDLNPIDKERNIFKIFELPTAGYRSIGYASFAAGEETQATAKGAVAIGDGVKAHGAWSVAFGKNNEVAYGSFASGSGNKVLAEQAHAEGTKNTIEFSGKRSHVEGDGNIVKGFGCHVEGNSNNINGNWNHAIGTNNIIKSGANNSFISGYKNTINNGESIFIHGIGLLTPSTSGIIGTGTSIFGRYNEQEFNNSIFVVGAGTESERKNAFTIQHDGKINLNGEVEIGGKLILSSDPVSDMESATKRYVDNEIQYWLNSTGEALRQDIARLDAMIISLSAEISQLISPVNIDPGVGSTNYPNNKLVVVYDDPTNA